MNKKYVLVVLGNRLNDDGSISSFQEERLKFAMEVIEEFKPIKVILSGGVANKLAKISEAEAMESYLLKKGISKDLLIKENKSMSTYENAFYSVPLARSLNADTIIVCTSDYHLANGEYNTIKSFVSMLKDTNISLMCYTKNTNM